MTNPFIKFDNSLEDAVRTVVKKSYPIMASRGWLNTKMPSEATGGPLIQGGEYIAGKSRQFMVWGFSRWGGKTIVDR